MAEDLRFRFSIDRGGTFTDVYCEAVESSTGAVRSSRVLKLLSEDPGNYHDAPTEGIRRCLELETKSVHPRGVPLPSQQIEFIRMGTTVATNALLERKGARVALLTTSGFRDLQVIGNQSRPKIFDLEIRRPELLYEVVEEIDERVVLVQQQHSALSSSSSSSSGAKEVLTGVSHERLMVETPLSDAQTLEALGRIKSLGISSLAVVFMHSYTFPRHERRVRELAEQLGGFTQISLSCEVMPMVRVVPRGCTTCVDAYLTPVLRTYLNHFRVGFDAALQESNKVSFMQSDGGLTPMQAFSGNRAILSGPAGGVVGYAMTSFHAEQPERRQPVIGFDMGGTSSDVSRYAGRFEHVFETTTAGVTIQSPQLDINTVAAGGGSRLFFRNGLFVVGPESAGAHPGPVCYRKHGGLLAVTDANVQLGRVQPSLFPSIFGPGEDLPLDLEGATAAFQQLTLEINAYNAMHSLSVPGPGEASNGSGSGSGSGTPAAIKVYSVDEVAYGFVRVANEAMCRPIRNLTTMKGYDVTKHALACFGGAGPQHCCAIAKALGMRRIYVHRFSGILSAYGLSLADVVEERQQPSSGRELSAGMGPALETLDKLEAEARAALRDQGFAPDEIRCLRFLNCRYQGTDTAIMVDLEGQGQEGWSTAAEGDDAAACAAYEAVFVEHYRREFGFELVGRAVLLDDVRVRAIGNRSQGGFREGVSDAAAAVAPAVGLSKSPPPPPVPHATASVYFEGGRVSTPVHFLSALLPGHSLDGPAILVQDVATVVVEPGCRADISATGDIEIVVLQAGDKRVTTELDAIYLSIFSHRFMGIAEQMGRTLQRTSISVNIKERLDFSCALFDPLGALVANAPHLPVHLGAMSEAVRYQVRHWARDLHEGDVLVSNHPQLAGGSHLPDITCITPIFHEGQIVFFVASRGHHADVGGIAPGSMPPLSRTLEQEGAAIVAFKLVDKGVFQEPGISALLNAPGLIEGNFGTRNLGDNLSDLKAQVAANQRGAGLMRELVGEYGLEVVQAYMGHIQAAAEQSVRAMLRAFSLREGMAELDSVHAEDFLDDGTKICLRITIDRAQGSAVFDFAGTGPEIYGNLNAPPAVTASAIIYCLRCLLPEVDIPLNQGCLAPVEIIIPPNSILSPSPTAAVVGGNVLTSQRITDVVLRAFKACAASQGCMNNLTFGNARMGYYETIAGGAGAGPSWHGCSGVHTHMTNTRITDPEILERRYPVVLRRFGLRSGSGGTGEFVGGEGTVRVLEFTEALTVSILSERRAFEPYGMRGGGPGARGLNLLHRAGRVISLGGKNTVDVMPGDKVEIRSPGGGGFGYGEKRTASAVPQAAALRSSGSLNQYTLDQEST